MPGAGSLAVSHVPTELSLLCWGVVDVNLQLKPGPLQGFSSGTDITSNLTTLLQTQLIATNVASSNRPHLSHRLLHAGLRNAKRTWHFSFCSWLGTELDKILGQRFLLDCSWTWKASQTRTYCESYRMIQLLLVTWILFLDIHIQYTENRKLHPKQQNMEWWVRNRIVDINYSCLREIFPSHRITKFHYSHSSLF